MSASPDRRQDGAHRVVVTGIGAVSGYGLGIEALDKGVRSGVTAIRSIERSQLGLTTTFPAAVPTYDIADHVAPNLIVMMDPFVTHGLIAAREAVAMAGLEPARLGSAGVFLGNGGGGELTREASFAAMIKSGRVRIHPLTVPRTNHQAVVSHIAAEYGIHGPATVIATGCAAGAHAIAQAIVMLRHGYVPVAVTGGTEASAIMSVATAFRGAQTLTSDTCRPFSRERTGFAMGEGAGILVLETLEHARERGATIIAELAGFGMATDPADQVQTMMGGAVRALHTALGDAGLSPDDVQYINAHGTATPLNDRVETQAIRAIFARHADRIPVSASKSLIGHCFGAAGALEAIITILALTRGYLPPTANYLGPDPECDLDYVTEGVRPCRFDVGLSNSFAFGGLNAVTAFKAWH
jgi:nodulation protein E